ncbi:protein-N(pi)-phosphohistidine--sugar phosphotransferase [Lactobacillus selangorensis]|uniref:phosphoenolpyruvate--glycerone phosphotransferase n=1 Tax=Lactobacillus selangorensis TaxID=81857 RepID=A0A0R2FKW9_9LACO|nr:dihydroxyacetone kinase phosphoryl donor subunit DhaM [Lactobacillus selangorensis]KRN29279.1 protein-N(pi)-phosphohistidine--sugar phosphotransferase [Lactobacillus selangorensis]KRN34192.1 protein-N(pi)-phosphohistidine--sugar phosphotransferase [Lactobacillus selangorensis]
MSYGILVVSHVKEIADGVLKLIAQVAADVPITTAGGTDDDGIGTSVAKITSAVEHNEGDEILAFYDLGSAKMNLDMVMELSDKKIHLYNVALVEGAYTAAALLQAGQDLPTIEKQLQPLKIK